MTCGIAPAVTIAKAETTTEKPAASRYYPFVGNWKGKGQMSEPGEKSVLLTLRLKCRKAASGWAVSCEMQAKNDKMTITESDLMGVDPITGTGHWYAVTNQGDAHDHITEWANAKTMHAHYGWSQDGKKMLEKISVVFGTNKSMEFHSIVTADGKAAGEFSGKLMR